MRLKRLKRYSRDSQRTFFSSHQIFQSKKLRREFLRTSAKIFQLIVLFHVRKQGIIEKKIWENVMMGNYVRSNHSAQSQKGERTIVCNHFRPFIIIVVLTRFHPPTNPKSPLRSSKSQWLDLTSTTRAHPHSRPNLEKITQLDSSSTHLSEQRTKSTQINHE